MSHQAQVAMLQALVEIGKARSSIRAALKQVDLANSIERLPEGALDLQLDLQGCAGTLARDLDEIASIMGVMCGGKAQSSEATREVLG